MRYAQITKEGICFADSYLSGKVMTEDMIPLTEKEPSPLGKRYINGTWEEVEQKPMIQLPSDTELIMQSITDLELTILEGGQKDV